MLLKRRLMCLLFSVPQLQATEWEQVSQQWLRVEAELLRERAVFGPRPGVLLSQDWVQDAAEGPNRTRIRIRKKALRRSMRVKPFWSSSSAQSTVLSLTVPCVLITDTRSAVSGLWV